jgi:Tol biopolymer transport system component
LLFEMATGRRAFEGASRTSLIAAIVSSQPPPISSVTPMTPPALDHVVRKCLEKDPDNRWQSAHDVAGELSWISEGGSQVGVTPTVSPRRRSRERVAWLLAAVSAAVAIAAITLLRTQRAPARKPVESSIVTPERLRIAFTNGLAISPDGEQSVFVLNDLRGGRTSLWLRPLGSATFRQLAGTEDGIEPFWSADSRKIGFFAGGKLKTFDTYGGTVTVVCDALPGGGASWSSAGTILLGSDRNGPLMAVNSAGGTPVPLTRLRAGDTSHQSPVFLPDGKTFLFLAVNQSAGKSGICQTSLDRPEEIKAVMQTLSGAVWVAPGIVLYKEGSRLIAQRYDAGGAKTVGDPITVTDQIVSFSAANDGKLLLQRNPNLVLSQLVWVDRSGTEGGRVGPSGLYFSPSISHDERRFAVDISNASDGNGDIWIYDVVRNSATRVTYEAVNESAPHWSADDRAIVYFATTDGGGDIFEVPAGGVAKPRVLVADAREKRPTYVSPDGQRIIFNSRGATNMDIWVWSAADKKATPWLATPFEEQCAQLSPDGKWIAYQSDESGRWEIYVRSFPDADHKWMISSAGGIMPVWRADGRELFYVSLDDKMTAVAVTPGPQFDAGAPVALFDAPLRQHPTTQYDVSHDGRRFLLNRRVDSATGEPIALLQNWDVKLAEK